MNIKMYQNGQEIKEPLHNTIFLIQDEKCDIYKVDSSFVAVLKSDEHIPSDYLIKCETTSTSACEDINLESLAKELSITLNASVVSAECRNLPYEKALDKLVKDYSVMLRENH